MLSDIIPAKTVIPVITINDFSRAVALAGCLQKSGLNVLEITLRTESALKCAETIIDKFPDLKIGIGTVLNPVDIANAVAIGAHFVVSPGLTKQLAGAAEDYDIPYLPGINTVSEAMLAIDLGYHTLKFFPAELSGGTAMLDHFNAILPGVRFCPTGGISSNNMADYLVRDNVFCIGGSWLTPAEYINNNNWQAIAKLAAEAVRVCRDSYCPD